MLSLLDPSALAPPLMPTMAMGAPTPRGIKREASLKARAEMINGGMRQMRERLRQIAVSTSEWATLHKRLEVATAERGITSQDIQIRVAGTCLDFERELSSRTRFEYDHARYAAPVPRMATVPLP